MQFRAVPLPDVPDSSLARQVMAFHQQFCISTSC